MKGENKMITAEELREITDKKQSQIAIEYIEKIIEPHIKNRAESGYGEANFFYPPEPIEFEEVVVILEAYGYEIGTAYSPYRKEEIGFRVMW